MYRCEHITALCPHTWTFIAHVCGSSVFKKPSSSLVRTCPWCSCCCVHGHLHHADLLHTLHKVSVLRLIWTHLQVVSPRRSLRWVLTWMKYDLNIRLRSKHIDASSGFGDQRWAINGFAWLTTVVTGARSKCRPMTSLSLSKRKTWWQTRPDFKPARWDLSLQDILNRKGISDWFLKNRDSCFSQRRTLKYWSKNASWSRYSGTSTTGTVESYGNWAHQRGVTKRTSATGRRIVSTRKSTARNWNQRNSRSGRILESTGETNCDEHSRQKLKENQSTIDELTAQISELQERLNLIHDSSEFQGVSSMQWKIIPRSSSPAVIFKP